MTRLLLVAVALFSLVWAQSEPKTTRQPTRTLIRVAHAHHPAGYTCPTHESGGSCLDLTHWNYVVGDQKFGLEARDEAIASIEMPSATSEDPSSEPRRTALIHADGTVPYAAVRYLQDDLVKSGFERPSVIHGPNAPTRVVDVLVSLTYDDTGRILSRSVNGSNAPDGAALVAALQKVVISVQRTGESSAVVVTVQTQASVPLQTVAAAEVACKVEGVSAVEVVVDDS